MFRAVKRFFGKSDDNSVVSIKGKMESSFRSEKSTIKTQKYNQKITYEELKDVISEKRNITYVDNFLRKISDAMNDTYWNKLGENKIK